MKRGPVFLSVRASDLYNLLSIFRERLIGQFLISSERETIDYKIYYPDLDGSNLEVVEGLVKWSSEW